MGVVFLARDRVTEQKLALKRCLPDPRGAFKPLFQREYYTLASISHPRIIRVYDYGLENGLPFYTMELLDGHDLAEIAPIPWRRACAYLRDVATSLLLLHQRRLVHRDLSPRNVRLTSDGHCRLFDFGALAPFGVPSEVAGTPSLMPPEVMQGLALDQRADLFSLGGLAYYMLTARHAFRAKDIAELKHAWAVAPLPPSQNAREAPATSLDAERIPEALDELILGLLQVDPLARPTSAAEVIERVTSIAALADDGEALSADNYLSSDIVGRTVELERIQAVVEEMRGTGTAGLVIEGATGSGVSRLLAELALRARLGGASVLTVDGSACQGPYSGIRSLVRKLFELSPHDARATLGEDGPVLLRAFPELGPHLPGVAPAAAIPSPGLFRAQIQASVTEWWLRLGARRRLVIAADDVQAMDEPSAAALAALAIDGAFGKVLVAFGRRTTDPFVAEAVLRALTATIEHLSLDNLDARGMSDLVHGLLGDVRHAERFTDWLHGLTGGNPRRTIDLVRYLVTSGVVGHREGVWILPQELGTVELPPGMDRAQSERLLQLGPLSLRLAEIMSLHDGPMSLDVCAALLEGEPKEAVVRTLGELVRANVLRVGGSTYYFAQEHLRSLVRIRLPADEQRILHRRIAKCLLDGGAMDTPARMAAGFHLVHAGDERRGADLLRETALDFVNRYDDMIAAAPALEEALRIYRQQKKPPLELLELLFPLCFAGYYVDRRLADRHARPTVLMAERLLGLSLTRKLRPLLGKRVSLWIGLAWGAFGFSIAQGRRGVAAFKAVLSTLTTCVVFLSAKSTICLEADEVEWFVERLEPLTALGPRHATTLSHRYAVGLSYVTRGHAARVVREFEGVLDELRHPENIVDFPLEAHVSLRGGALYALGAMQSFLDTSDALGTAEELEHLGHRIYHMAADQIRANYYACRGDLENAAVYRRKLEAHALTNGSVWQAEVWAPSSQILADIATDDVIGTKRTWNELARHAREVPSLRRYEIGARLVYLLQTGRAEEALAEFPAMFEGSEPNGFIGWSTSMGSLAFVYNALGRYGDARRVCEETLSLLEPGDLAFVALNLRVELQLARALAGLGDVDGAVARLETLSERHGKNDGRVTMGLIETALADMAILCRDAAAFERHAGAVEALFYPTKNPALVAQASRLRLRARFAGVTSDPPSLRKSYPASARLTSWARALEACEDDAARARVALELIVANTRARRGFWFEDEPHGPVLVASSSAEQPSPDVVDAVANEFSRYRDDRTDIAETMLTAVRATTMVTAEDAEDAAGAATVYQPLIRHDSGRLRVLAVCALERGSAPLLPPDWELMQLVASHLD